MCTGRRLQLTVVFLILLVLIGVGFGSAWMLKNNSYVVEITLNGDQEMNVEYGDSYEEPGVQAGYHGTRIRKKMVPLEVTQEGTVDTSALGTYQIVYSAACEYGSKSVTRTVHVVDTLPPEITLNQNPDSYTLPGHPYEEEGYTAEDRHDGDLTQQVHAEEKDGVVYYTVTDSAGNTATVQREIHYDDPVAPELKLSGSSKMRLVKGQEYKEPGYSAVDNCDGDLTENVAVSGSVDTQTPGNYTLTYTVADGYGNESTAERTVEVVEAGSGGIIYLTFDDGPSPNTDRLLDVLAKYNVKATFFVVNTPYIGTVARIAEEGHTVALHTSTHKFSQVYASDEAYFSDLKAISDSVEHYTGQKSMLIRFPGGSSNTVSRAYSKGIMTRLTKAVQEQGYHYFDWNVDSMDAGGAKTSEQVFHNVINGVSGRDASVVLQHDLWGFSVDAVERIIQWGQKNGYTFLPLTADSPGCHHGVNN